MMAALEDKPRMGVVIATDMGGVKRAQKWADKLYGGCHLEVGVVGKQRTGNDDAAMAEGYYGPDVTGKTVLLVDDEAMTLGTMVSAAKVLKKLGAREIWALAYHGVLAGPAITRLVESPIAGLIVSNSVPVPAVKIERAGGKLYVVPIEEFIIKAMWKWHMGESLGGMIEYAYE
jgi:ribose-phosphate pyrophosphokinase